MTPRYCIVWEDPAEPDAPVKVTHPAPKWLAARIAGGLSEEVAMEALVLKDLPPRVWAAANRQRFYIVPRTLLPAAREFRNAWRLADA